MTTNIRINFQMSGQMGFEAQGVDYWFACLSFLEAGDQVGETRAFPPPPHHHHHHTCTHLTPVFLRGCFKKPLMPVSKAWSLRQLQQCQLRLRGLKPRAKKVVTKKSPLQV